MRHRLGLPANVAHGSPSYRTLMPLPSLRAVCHRITSRRAPWSRYESRR